MYLKDLRFTIPSETLVWPHYVGNVNFVCNWLYFLICLISDLVLLMFFFVATSVMWGLFSQLYYWWFYFCRLIMSLLKIYYCGHFLFLWFQIFTLDVLSLMLNLNFEAFSCEFYRQCDIWWAYQRDSWQSSICITLGYGVISGSSRAPPSPQDLSLGQVLSVDYYELMYKWLFLKVGYLQIGFSLERFFY